MPPDGLASNIVRGNVDGARVMWGMAIQRTGAEVGHLQGGKSAAVTELYINQGGVTSD